VATSHGFAVPPGYAELEPQADAARRALAVRATGTVPCNNDLLAANFIDDGEKIWLIDY
jgi:thiamine kinase-like enzyme